jgi:hypothetical protein
MQTVRSGKAIAAPLWLAAIASSAFPRCTEDGPNMQRQRHEQRRAVLKRRCGLLDQAFRLGGGAVARATAASPVSAFPTPQSVDSA